MKFKNVILSMFIIALIGFASCEKEENKVTGVTLDKSNLSIVVGGTEQLSATVEPAEAVDKNVLWTSSDATIASVNNGLVEGKSAGEAVITAETVDGGFKATCSVTVTENAVNVSGITLGTTEWSAIPGETKQLDFVIEPINATDQTVTWFSSSDAVATVNQSGLVTAIGAGTATITVTTTDGAKTATCEVTVTAVGTITEIMSKGFLTNSDAKSIDIACNSSGIPFLVNIAPHSTSSEKGLVQVHQYSGSGTTWTKYSNSDVNITGAESYTPSIAIKDDGTIFVAYQYLDDVNDNRYQQDIVSAYDGSNWITLGGDGVDNSNCFILGSGFNQGTRTQMAFKQDGTLMVAACQYGDGYVSYFDNGGDWTDFVAGDWTSYSGYKLDDDNYWAGNVNLAIHGNKPYAYIRSSSGTLSCGILEGSETNGENIQWEWLGNVLVGNDIGGSNKDFETSLAVSSTGEIYTSYQKIVDGNINVYVKHFNKTTNNWEVIKTTTYNEYPNEAEVVISNDVLYLAVAKYDGGIDIYKYDSEQNSWNFEGTTPDFGAFYYTIDLAAGNNGEFYIAYSITDDGSGYKIGAYKYSPAN